MTISLATAVLPAVAQGTAGSAPTIAVTADNYIRAETDTTFAAVARRGALGRFTHRREMLPLDKQVVSRTNRDTLYSTAVFDLAAGPVSITLPDAGRRYLAMQAIDEDHYTRAVAYSAGTYTFDQAQIGTRYLLVAIRILANPADTSDMDAARALQDRVKISQKSSGILELPSWDPAGLKKVRDALLVLNTTLRDSRGMFGSRDEVEPVRHMIGTAMAWGGNPARDAIYIPVTPARNDATTVHRMTVAKVPVDGFWSISVYNADGYFQPNSRQAYSLNNLTAKPNADGTVTIQFGGCDATNVVNCLPVTPGWNYMVRLYRPHADVLSGKWIFPEARPVP
jgi:hypothetical protein